jgi:hypothetical protein
MRKGIPVVLMLLVLATAAPVSAREAPVDQIEQVGVIGKSVARMVGQVKRIFSRIGSTGDHLGPPWPGGSTQPAARGK